VPASGRTPVQPAAVRVAEVTAERDLLAETPLPLHLLGGPELGETDDGGRHPAVQVQLRTMLRRVAVGAAVARRVEVVEAVRALPGVPGLIVSPVGGTFVVGGPSWLGLAAVGTPPPGALPIDWMLAALRAWLEARLAAIGVTVEVGRVAGAWCPGFSDVAVNGRKLAGLGFRATRDWVVMRGVMAVTPMTEDDLRLLQGTHHLIGLEVERAATTSLAELTGDPTWTAERAMTLLSGADHPSRCPSPR